MMIQCFFPILRKALTVWFGILAGAGLIFGCGGGGGGKSGSAGVTPAGNQAPTATISSPAGTYFKEGENIEFSGSATDDEDGPLTGSALVWTSSIDGPIGTDATLITSALSAGDHDITLTATDSENTTATATIPTITVARTRFIKMGTQTSGVTDASNAFDGDQDTAATFMTADTEFIHFKSFIGGADTFFFKIKVGASTPGSRLAIHGLTPNATWQPVSDIDLDNDKIVTVKVANAQQYKDAEGYINLRARWEGGGSPDIATVFEFWRVDPVYAGPKTQGVIDPDAAFDGDSNTTSSATIDKYWGEEGNVYNYLQIKAYVGQSETFTFNMRVNRISADQSMVIDIETSPDNWTILNTSSLNSNNDRTITVPDAQDYLDADGYISLRARWVGYGTENAMDIYEIWRTDPFFIGPKTANDPSWISSPESAVDGNVNSFAIIYFFWSELDHYDFMHLQAYVGDASVFAFSIQSAPSTPITGAELIVEGELEPDSWSQIERISHDNISPDNIGTTMINMLNARQYVDANGYLSIRVRWEADSMVHDAYVYEIRREAD